MQGLTELMEDEVRHVDDIIDRTQAECLQSMA